MKTSQPNTFANRRVCFANFILAITLGAPFVMAEEPSEFLGTFDNNEIAITIRSVDDGFAGLINQGSESLPFKASIKKNRLVGTFMKEGVAYAFSARMIKDDLEITLGLQSSKLRRKSEQSEYVGTFRAKELAIVVKKTGGRFHGQFIQDKDAVEFLGLLDKGKLRGEFTKDEVKYLFTAALNGNKLKLTFGLQSFDLDRVKGKTLVAGNQVPNTARRKVLLADGKDLVTSSVLVSPDNRRVAYITQKDSKRRVVINGVAGKPYYLINLWKFSPNSRRLAYIATIKNRYAIVIDEKESELFDGFWFGPTPFSPDSSLTAFAGRQGNSWHIVKDGKKADQSFEAIIGIAFSPDSRRLAYAVQKNRKWSISLDGKVSGSYGAVGFGQQPFSPDSRRFSFGFHLTSGQHVSIDGNESKSYDVVTNGVFSEDSKRFAFNVVHNNQHQVVVDGEEGKSFDQISGLRFSPDNKNVVYAARKGAAWHMIENDKAGAPFDAVSGAVFGKRGNRMAYIARRGRERLVVRDGKIEASHKQIRHLTLSPNGNRLAYAALNKAGEWQVIMGDTISRPFKSAPIGIVFSSDSQHVVFAARRGTDWHIVVDGVEGEPIGELMPGSLLVMNGPSKFHTVVRAERQFYRLDVEILN